MFNDEQFRQWCNRLNLMEITEKAIEQVRSSEPSRRVGSGKRNVSGSYPSRKMGVTIQFESHRNELARIHELENDPDVLEYYDQPPPIELCYPTKNGRIGRHLYTPDFFIIRVDSAGWEECKTEEDLVKLSEYNPNRYCRGEDEVWRCPPGEAHAERLGLQFWVWSNALISWTFQQNFVWLEDYLELEPQAVENQAADEVSTLVQENTGITLAELLQRIEIATADDLYVLITTEQVYVDLNAARLAEPERVKVFQNREIALAFEHISEVAPVVPPSNLRISRISVGTSFSWDGECWQIANTGDTTTLLLRHDGKFVDLPNAAFDALLQQGKIISAEETRDPVFKEEAEDILRRARPEDITEANRRYQMLLPYLCDDSPTYPSSTIRRWRDQYRLAEKLYGSGYFGLLPNHGSKGNFDRRLNEAVLTLMDQFIDERYENLKQRRIQRVYQDFVEACKSHELKLIPVCRKTFTRAIKKRAGYRQTLKRKGRRSAVQKEEFYWELEQTTPRHGSRPFEIAHIDHTQLDVELVSSLASLSLCNINLGNGAVKHNLGRPWATFMVDAYSRRLLAAYITYEEPSYRSCMMAIRICVQRFNRFPQILVVDNGAEFHSIYFEQLLAMYVCTKK